ncbi:hypothetical protein BaRGS_00031794 [Batillaria attramentaria]|uniref:Uncharacterized protein n=1 Tax=Batillaria attramentaria TaxID=370345 RepID=A0ABD0JQN0_9CAEN
MSALTATDPQNYLRSMIFLWTLLAAVVAVLAVGAKAGDGCYKYYDHASKYNLDYIANSYPWDEVNQAMNKNPQLSQVLATGTRVPTSRPPGSHYYTPVSVVCPANRYMLKAFQVDGKQCYVVKPEVQQVRYAKCSDKYNRDCHYCSYSQGGISKCEEEYEWQQVWAYCKPLIVHPQPKPYVPQPKPYVPRPRPYVPKPYVPQPRPHVPQPKPYHKPNPAPYYPPQKPVVQNPKPVYDTGKIFARKTTQYDPWRPQQTAYSGRYKRGVTYNLGKVEQISLYLPYQCSCKNFKC